MYATTKTSSNAYTKADSIDIAPVYEGAVQHIASKRIEFGGLELTNPLAESLKKSNPHANLTTSDVKELKELYVCCAEDQTAFEETLKSSQNEQHTLPDGQVITIPREKYVVGEALYFQPSILGSKEDGIVKQLAQTISSVSSENHHQLLNNTVLCGGTSSMKGLEESFQKEAILYSPSIHPTLVKVLACIFSQEKIVLKRCWLARYRSFCVKHE